MDRHCHVYAGMAPDHCCFGENLRVLPDGEWARRPVGSASTATATT